MTFASVIFWKWLFLVYILVWVIVYLTCSICIDFIDCSSHFSFTEQLNMAWCTTSATSSYSLVVFLVLVGLILGSTSEPIEPQREPWLGSLDCPPSLTVQWNEILVRPPYVVKVIQYPTDDFDSMKQNSTDDFDSTKQNSTYDFDGLFPSNVFWSLSYFCTFFLFIYSSFGILTPPIFVYIIFNR